MSILVPFNGVNYIIPTPGEVGWGSNLDAFFVAIGAGSLQKTGGNFTLSAPINFGPSFGLSALTFSGQGSNTATGGLFNLAAADTINFRNTGNTANLALGINGSNQLTFNGVPIESSALTSAHIFVGNASNVATDIAMSGAVTISNTGVTTLTPGTAGQVLHTNPSGTAVVFGAPLFVNVKDFGAVGNGTTDDTAAIQAAHDSIVASGQSGTLLIQPGTYKCTAGLTVNVSFVSVLGESAVLNFSTMTSGSAITFIGSSSNAYAGNPYYNADKYISNLTLIGNGFGGSVIGFRFYSATEPGPSHFKVYNCNISQFGTGISIDANSYLLSFFGTDVWICGTAVDIPSATNSGERILFSGCALFNSNYGITCESAIADIHYTGGSVDGMANAYFQLSAGNLYVTDAHIEGNFGPSYPTARVFYVPSSASGTLFATFESCDFIVKGARSNPAFDMQHTCYFTLNGSDITCDTNSSVTVVSNTGAGGMTTINSLFNAADANFTIGANDYWWASSNLSTIYTDKNITSAGALTLTTLGTGILHSSSGGLFSSSLVVNADISTSAAIARSKIAAGTPWRLLADDVSGNITEIAFGSSGQVLTSTGATSLPTFQNVAGTGTVNSGTQYELAYYATSTNVVSGLTLITASRALVSDVNGLPVASATTATELGYVSGVTSAIQTQLNAKSTPAANGTVNSGTQYQMAYYATSTNAVSGDSFITTNAANQLIVTNNTGIGTTTPVKRLTVQDSSSASTTPGTNPIVWIAGGNSSVNTLSEIGFSYGGSTTDTNPPVTLGYQETVGSGFTKGDLVFCTRNVTTDTAPTEALRIKADHSIIQSGNISFTSTSTQGIVGTTTNDSAAAGNVGEVISSAVVAATPASGSWADLTSITLTAGTWTMSNQAYATPGSGSLFALDIGISTTSGSSSSGLTQGDNWVGSRPVAASTAASELSLCIASYIVRLSSTTTYYLKCFPIWTTSAGTTGGRITAIRIR